MFSSLSASAILERLEAAEIASARMNTVSEFANHPQLVTRDRWMTVDSPAGPIRMLRPPVTMEPSPRGAHAGQASSPAANRIPALGEDTDTILRSLGIADDTIAAWRKKGAI